MKMILSPKDREAMFELYIHAPNLPPENSFVDFQVLCFQGIPDKLRARCWQILLRILPFDRRNDWKKILKSSRDNYYNLVQHFIRAPNDVEIGKLIDSVRH
jgi:hypothetical protein